MKIDSVKNKSEYSNLMSPKEAAAYLNVSLKTVYRWTGKRQVPFYRIGRGIRFKKEDMDLCLKKCFVESIVKRL